MLDAEACRDLKLVIIWESASSPATRPVMEAVVGMLDDVGVRGSSSSSSSRAATSRRGGRARRATGTSSATATATRPG